MPLGFSTEDSFMGMHFGITVSGNNDVWAVKNIEVPIKRFCT